MCFVAIACVITEIIHCDLRSLVENIEIISPEKCRNYFHIYLKMIQCGVLLNCLGDMGNIFPLFLLSVQLRNCSLFSHLFLIHSLYICATASGTKVKIW